ncbi:sensor histidine kinase [Ramlibacter rhizophilus]|nr:sensor histidine kinase [Ramlibacter rhizophilus]
MSDPPGSRPLRTYLIRLALLGLVPLAVFAAVALYIAAQVHRNELARSTLDLSRAVASAVQAEQDGTMSALASLSRSPELLNGDVPGFYRHARRLMEVQFEWSAITLTDAQGRVLFWTSMPLGEQPDTPNEPASVRAVLQTGRPALGPAIRNAQGEPSYAVRYPVVQDGRLRYVLSAVITPERLLRMLQRQRVPSDWVIAILDPQLRVFARSRGQEQYALREATPALRRLLSTGKREGSGIAAAQEGSAVVTGFSRTPDSNWLVAVGAPTTPLAQAFTPTLALYVAGVLVSLMICAGLALRTARRVSEDIREVAQAATGLGQGQPVAIVPSRIAEVERLGAALRDASGKLQTAQAAQGEALTQAEEAGRAKDAFLAMLGHELRNPLAPMVSAMDLLDLRADPASARERAILRRQMDHLRRLVDDLLDVARIARGLVEIAREPVDLAAELRAAVEDLREAHALGPDHLRWHSALAQAWIVGDAQRLVQVFSNLIANALRHGGERPVTVSLSQQAGMFRIAVEDEGDGMNAGTLAHVFEPFYQSPASPAERRGGLGLGLAIVRSIVEAHGGRVLAHSEGLGQGSCFEVLLWPSQDHVHQAQDPVAASD